MTHAVAPSAPARAHRGCGPGGPALLEPADLAGVRRERGLARQAGPPGHDELVQRVFTASAHAKGAVPALLLSGVRCHRRRARAIR